MRQKSVIICLYSINAIEYVRANENEENQQFSSHFVSFMIYNYCCYYSCLLVRVYCCHSRHHRLVIVLHVLQKWLSSYRSTHFEWNETYAFRMNSASNELKNKKLNDGYWAQQPLHMRTTLGVSRPCTAREQHKSIRTWKEKNRVTATRLALVLVYCLSSRTIRDVKVIALPFVVSFIFLVETCFSTSRSCRKWNRELCWIDKKWIVLNALQLTVRSKPFN